ncbi:MAG: helix-turn-helix transcriptional regulator [Candidatus Izemoplasmatales bacterium]|nr:helix-turn-helix transcriptional regulator [Candidatus Izemoplasmatales bacterium]
MVQEIVKILDYIEENILLEIKLEDISKVAYYSPSHISRWFNRYVGLSLNEYINKRRLSLAALMIKNTKKPIEYVAHFYGFNSSKYFSNLFKKYFNVSPRNYRFNNFFVDLQLKRLIKGGENMKILKISNLVDQIMKNSFNINTLFDTVSVIENCILYEQKNSDIVLIAYFLDEKNDYMLMQVDVNLITGKYVSKLILKTTPSKEIEISKIVKEDDKVYVEYKNISMQKTILASLIPVDTRIEVTTNVLEEIVNESGYENEIINNEMYDEVKELANTLKSANHVYEIENAVKNDNGLLILREFGKEFILLKLLEKKNHLFLFSIYLNFEDGITEINNIYGVLKGIKTVNFVLENNMGCIYLNKELHSQSFLNVNESVPPQFVISFPKGICGRGNWDISNLFHE